MVETDLNLLGIGGSRTEKKWDFVTKIVLFSDREKLLKFEAEGQEFAKFLRSLEQFKLEKKILGFRNMQEKLEKSNL